MSPMNPVKWIFFILFFPSLLFSQAKDQAQQVDQDFLQKDGPTIDILGISLRRGYSTTNSTLRKLGLSQINDLHQKDSPFRISVYQGIPPGPVVREGGARVHFFQNRLYKIELFFEPSYKNFLLLRSQLFKVLGERFTKAKEQVVIDTFLKSYLTSLKAGEFDQHTETAIRNSLMRGETFYDYELADSKNELSVSLSFRSWELAQDPKLTLTYTESALEKEALTFKNDAQQKLLPK